MQPIACGIGIILSVVLATADEAVFNRELIVDPSSALKPGESCSVEFVDSRFKQKATLQQTTTHLVQVHIDKNFAFVATDENFLKCLGRMSTANPARHRVILSESILATSKSKVVGSQTTLHSLRRLQDGTLEFDVSVTLSLDDGNGSTFTARTSGSGFEVWRYLANGNVQRISEAKNWHVFRL